MRLSRALALLTYFEADDMGTMAAVPLKVRPGAQDNARAPFFTGCSPGRMPTWGRSPRRGATRLNVHLLLTGRGLASWPRI